MIKYGLRVEPVVFQGVFPVRDSEPGRPLVFTGGAMAVGGGRVAGVNLGNNLVGVSTASHSAGCLERSGVSNNLERGGAMSSNVGPCRENNSNRGEGERASADRDRMAGLDRCSFPIQI